MHINSIFFLCVCVCVFCMLFIQRNWLWRAYDTHVFDVHLIRSFCMHTHLVQHVTREKTAVPDLSVTTNYVEWRHYGAPKWILIMPSLKITYLVPPSGNEGYIRNRDVSEHQVYILIKVKNITRWLAICRWVMQFLDTGFHSLEHIWRNVSFLIYFSFHADFNHSGVCDIGGKRKWFQTTYLFFLWKNIQW